MDKGRDKAWILFLLVGLIWVGSAALGGMLASRMSPWGGSSDRKATEVKAALVFKFLRYVEWDETRFENEKAPMIVGVVGPGPIGAALGKALKGKEYKSHPIIFRRFASPQEVLDCHLLFVAESTAGQKELKRVLERLPRQGVFVVGESKDFVRRGGVLNFYVEQEGGVGKVHFEVNPDEAKRRKIKISANLLKLARIVRDSKGSRATPHSFDSNSSSNYASSEGQN